MNSPIKPPRCDPHTYRIVRRRSNQGNIATGRQCSRCGASGGAVPSDALDVDSLPWWDSGLVESWQRVLADHNKASERERWWSRYRRHLESPEWKAIRAKVLERCHHVCEGCGAEKAWQVHHKSYEHLGHEFLFELLGLCDNCHARWHGKQKRGS
jgi:hypothetical protein